MINKKILSAVKNFKFINITQELLVVQAFHEEINNNKIRTINFATGKNFIIKSTYDTELNVVEVTNTFATLQEIDKSDNNAIDKQ
ncbi:hypothetical protein PUN28_002107 [Cardiocondyla obscurior]|uniref:Uncharacterized protein n=1 Tax=Cardiocondyla obscurior TaxID=286306 RepID=A0AAW2GSK8_9HYME